MSGAPHRLPPFSRRGIAHGNNRPPKSSQEDQRGSRLNHWYAGGVLGILTSFMKKVSSNARRIRCGPARWPIFRTLENRPPSLWKRFIYSPKVCPAHRRKEVRPFARSVALPRATLHIPYGPPPVLGGGLALLGDALKLLLLFTNVPRRGILGSTHSPGSTPMAVLVLGCYDYHIILLEALGSPWGAPGPVDRENAAYSPQLAAGKTFRKRYAPALR
jgi:hypothetical protein